MVVRLKKGRPCVATGQRPADEKSNWEEASQQAAPYPGAGSLRVAKHSCPQASRTRQHGYRIKPHGQLVLVSLRPYSPSTPSLSTSWSWTTLQGGQASGKTNLQASFPLRCFQRLSLPHVATRRCHWRDNRYTRGASTPVLSY